MWLLNQVLLDHANAPTWTFPAEDEKLSAFHGADYFVDLNSSAFGYQLAETLYLGGAKLDPNVKKLVLQRLEERIFAPFRSSVLTGSPCGWLGSRQFPLQNNWNPVCLSGVVGAALAVISDKLERAFYVAAAEHYSQYYLNSFAEDGYCTEGAGYWNYGFGRYALLREEIMMATGGRLDLLAQPRVLNRILYAKRFMLSSSGFVPPFADSRFGMKINQSVLAYYNQALDLKIPNLTFSEPFGFAGSIGEVEAPGCPDPPINRAGMEDPLRSFFEDAGVLVCRPGVAGGLAIGIKAGGNLSHSHNDIGSYVIVIGDEQPTGDPGGPLFYVKGIFGTDRLKAKILNSYGHPVPVIGGQLQRDATEARPVVLASSFGAHSDEIVIDMASAYQVASLRKFSRTMCYKRDGIEEIFIIDQASFDSPTSFEDVLITRGDWEQIDANILCFSMGEEKLLARISASSNFSIKPEMIEEFGVTLTRIGLVFDEPCSAAFLKVSFTRAHPGSG